MVCNKLESCTCLDAYTIQTNVLQYYYLKGTDIMRQPWTSERIRTAVVGAEQQLEQVISIAALQDPPRKTILEASYQVVHDAIVSLVTLFRDHVADAAAATLIARAYAKCVAGIITLPKVACIRHLLEVVQAMREQHLPA